MLKGNPCNVRLYVVTILSIMINSVVRETIVRYLNCS